MRVSVKDFDISILLLDIAIKCDTLIAKYNILIAKVFYRSIACIEIKLYAILLEKYSILYIVLLKLR